MLRVSGTAAGGLLTAAPGAPRTFAKPPTATDSVRRVSTSLEVLGGELEHALMMGLVIDGTSETYAVTVASSVYIEVKKLTASDAEDNDRFGASVAISGDIVVVGAYLEAGEGSNRGAAYVFERRGGGADGWVELQKLTASDAEDDDRFGCAVAVSGDTIVVGAWSEDGEGTDRGAAYVFERKSGSGLWAEAKKLTASDAEDGDGFGGGRSVAISGDTVVVGAGSEDGSGDGRGAAYVFERDSGGAGNWGEVKKLTASDAEDGDWFGGSVAADGDTIVVGASYEDGMGVDLGAAYIFERDSGGSGNWGEVKKLSASDPENSDYFGQSVAVNAPVGGRLAHVVVTANGEDGAGSNRGAAYVFERDSDGPGNWGQERKLSASDAEDDDYFGYAVAINGLTIVVGAGAEDGAGTDRGAAYVFGRNIGGVGNWGQARKLTASDAEDDDGFGYPAVSGDTVVVGASAEGGAGTGRGAAYVFVPPQYTVYLPLVLYE
jgi:hypothetical protein